MSALITEMNLLAAGKAHLAKTTAIARMNRMRSGSHDIYYHVEDDAVIVIRILHQRMDPTRHLS